jgi:hypothetical protein
MRDADSAYRPLFLQRFKLLEKIFPVMQVVDLINIDLSPVIPQRSLDLLINTERRMSGPDLRSDECIILKGLTASPSTRSASPYIGEES